LRIVRRDSTFPPEHHLLFGPVQRDGVHKPYVTGKHRLQTDLVLVPTLKVRSYEIVPAAGSFNL
jgi:hypothetical protein